MRCRVVAAVERVLVVLLLAVVGQRLAGDLPSGDAATVGERGEIDRVDLPALLQDVEHLLDAFIDERHGADLNPDRLAGFAGSSRLTGQSTRNRRNRRQPGRPLEVLVE